MFYGSKCTNVFSRMDALDADLRGFIWKCLNMEGGRGGGAEGIS
jgi:hypothetical protein